MEYWDVCDQNGRRTGGIRPKGASYAAGEFHPAIEAWVINSRGEILIQQRSMQCEILPGVWALTTGRMLAGESTAQGCIRELREELGITVTPEQLTFLRRIPRGELLWDLYLVRADAALDTLTLQKEEVAQAKWVSPSAFRRLLKENQLFFYPEIMSVLTQAISSFQGKKQENHPLSR
ncbi:MAG TPA: NUDIX domain-containing protein [Candidatus Fimivicinus intestinavium]|nr:NUDIX domain-containing protein [Candidatus Fimivicinus intestinavium]